MTTEQEKSLSFAEIIKAYGLNDEQVEFIQAYSRKRSASRFEREASKLVGNPEMIKDWMYQGYYDTGDDTIIDRLVESGTKIEIDYLFVR